MAVYKPKYRDSKTGKLRQSAVWWYEFIFARKRYRGSIKETRKTLATEFEEKSGSGWSARSQESRQNARRVAAGRSLRRSRRTERGTRAESRSWVKERTAEVERVLGRVILPDLTQDTVRHTSKRV
jgi:hypothetical protein